MYIYAKKMTALSVEEKAAICYSTNLFYLFPCAAAR
jgi:hypothetical protein